MIQNSCLPWMFVLDLPLKNMDFSTTRLFYLKYHLMQKKYSQIRITFEEILSVILGCCYTAHHLIPQKNNEAILYLFEFFNGHQRFYLILLLINEYLSRRQRDQLGYFICTQKAFPWACTRRGAHQRCSVQADTNLTCNYCFVRHACSGLFLLFITEKKNIYDTDTRRCYDFFIMYIFKKSGIVEKLSSDCIRTVSI